MNMKKPIKVMTIFGTRPEAIKMAPLVLELTKAPRRFRIDCDSYGSTSSNVRSSIEHF